MGKDVHMITIAPSTPLQGPLIAGLWNDYWPKERSIF